MSAARGAGDDLDCECFRRIRDPGDVVWIAAPKQCHGVGLPGLTGRAVVMQTGTFARMPASATRLNDGRCQ
jgi:hypothetical protein